MSAKPCMQLLTLNWSANEAIDGDISWLGKKSRHTLTFYM